MMINNYVIRVFVEVELFLTKSNVFPFRWWLMKSSVQTNSTLTFKQLQFLSVLCILTTISIIWLWIQPIYFTHVALTRTSFNGRYPVLFNFPLLQELIITYCPSLKWDLEMLAGLPSLKELYCPSNNLTGNIGSLRVLKGSLEKVDLPGVVTMLRAISWILPTSHI